MKQVLFFLLLAAMAFGCNRVPITHRRQSTWENEAALQKMCDSMYRQFIATHKITTNKQQAAQVQLVGQKLSIAITNFFKTYDNGKYYPEVSAYKWAFNTIQDSTINAWCMPGGKVVVYTGLMKVTQDETGLAVVIGHEIAHAIAKHGNERMTQEMKAHGLGSILSIALSGSPQATQDVFGMVYGAAGGLTLLKYSRKHETEADKIGLVFMALAGYDPSKSIEFWERMSKANGTQIPQWLSSHPSDQTRINELKAWLPEALKYYKKP